jgi:hypothetical protein
MCAQSLAKEALTSPLYISLTKIHSRRPALSLDMLDTALSFERMRVF